MKLIADSGATKTTWAFALDGKIINKVRTQGLSPYFMDEEAIYQVMKKHGLAFSTAIEAIHFYGTGCNSMPNKQKLRNVLAAYFPETEKIVVESDLLAAARALCGREEGIACILGTGSNTCYYDGKKIKKNIRGYGYVIGDYGSGAALGKQLIRDYLFNQMPPHLKWKLETSFQLSEEKILEEVYQGQMPSSFLASFARFATDHISEAYILNVLNGHFSRFLDLMVVPYPKALPVHFIGSIAYYFRELIQAQMKEKNIEAGVFLQEPMERLVSFHF
jgi:glucosamine kinase